jgi:hypothetical protein
LAADREMELERFLLAIRQRRWGPMPMPPAEVVNSIQTSFDNARMLSAICTASCETSRAEAFREKPWLTGLPYPCLAQRFLCESDCRGARRSAQKVNCDGPPDVCEQDNKCCGYSLALRSSMTGGLSSWPLPSAYCPALSPSASFIVRRQLGDEFKSSGSRWVLRP